MSALRWYVVRAEDRALGSAADVVDGDTGHVLRRAHGMLKLAAELAERGIETLVPVAYARAWGPRRTRIWRAVPAYGPFIFARLDSGDAHSWPGILELPGVSAVLRAAGSEAPWPVPEATMAEVREMNAEEREKLKPERREKRLRAAWRPMTEALGEMLAVA